MAQDYRVYKVSESALDSLLDGDTVLKAMDQDDLAFVGPDVDVDIRDTPVVLEREYLKVPGQMMRWETYGVALRYAGDDTVGLDEDLYALPTAPGPVESFYDALEDEYEVQREDDYAFFGESEHRDLTPLFGIVDEYDVSVFSLWTAYDDGDDTDLGYFISLEEE